MKQITTLVALILCVVGTTTGQAQTTESEPIRAVAKPASEVKFEAGVRYWQGTSNYQVDLGRPEKLMSRLTTENMNFQSIELFTRLDKGHFFTKGTIGLGGISSGQFHDEDWNTSGYVGTIKYSNTLSQISNGAISDATIDAGLAVGKKDRKIGLFVGYGYFSQRFDIYGCTQLVNPEYNPYCGMVIPTDRLVSTMDTRWHSLRVGTVVESKLSRHFKVDGEVVLAGTKLVARDNHLARSGTTWFDGYGYGYGIQLEVKAVYIINDHLGVSGGWRYRSLKAYGGNDYCISGGCEDNGSERFSASRSGLVIGVTGRF